MFHSIVDETVKLTKKQAHSYNNMSLSLVNHKEEDLLIKRSEFYQLELVNQIGFEELYKSIFVGLENSVSNIFCKKKKLKAFIRLWEILNLVEYWEDIAHKDGAFVVDKYNEYNQLRGRAVNQYRNLIENYLLHLSSNGGSPLEVEFATHVDSLHLKWQELANRTDPRVLHRNLIIPMRTQVGLDFLIPTLSKHGS